MRQTWAGPGPETELPSQTGPEAPGAGAGRGEYDSDRAGAFQAHARRTWIGAEPIGAGAGQDVSESDGAGARSCAAAAVAEVMPDASKPDRAGLGAGAGPWRGEYESDRAGAFQAHARRTWIGAKPIRAGAGQDVSESDGAGARHTRPGQSRPRRPVTELSN